MNQRIRRALTIVLGLAAAAQSTAAPAAPPPAGRVYFTILVGLEGPHELAGRCLEFERDTFCLADGSSCGTWRRTGSKGRRSELELRLSVADGSDAGAALEAIARLDARGAGSSIGGTATVVSATGQFNFAFGGRQLPRRECQRLIGRFDPSPAPDLDVAGSGVLATESRRVRGFDTVSLVDTGLLVVDRTGSESLEITAEDNILPILRSDVRGGELLLGIASRGDVRPTEPITYRLTARDLDGLALGGNAEARLSGLVSDRFGAELGGNSTARAEGLAERQELQITGSARYSAESLRTREVSIDQSGSSRTLVRVSERLVGRVGGSAVLEYIGDPIVEVETSGSAVVRRIDG